jgi:hypothetical protein
MSIKQYWNVTHTNKQGEILWEQKHVKNAIANLGAEAVLEYVYRGNIYYRPGMPLVATWSFLSNNVYKASYINGVYYSPTISLGRVMQENTQLTAVQWDTSEAVTVNAINAAGPGAYCYYPTTNSLYIQCTDNASPATHIMLLANFYMGLCNYSPVVTDTMISMQGEPLIQYGYKRQIVELSGVGFLEKGIAPDGNVRLTSKQVVFTNTDITNSIGPITNAFITTSSDNSGKLWAYLPLAMTRTIRSGDSMTYQFYVEEGNN